MGRIERRTGLHAQEPCLSYLPHSLVYEESMTDQDLQSQINFDTLGIPPSLAAFADHLRNRGPLSTFGDKHDSHDQDAADATVRGDVNEQNIPYTFPEGKIDWHFNLTRQDNDYPINNEWQWQLNRMSYWPNLGRTYQATRNETYAQTFVDHLRSWADQCPRPEDKGNYAESCWRTIESGIRMARSWPDTYHLFLDSPTFTDDDILLYVKLCVEHGLHLRANHRERGNWLAMEMAGLYTIGAVFPELKEAAAWRSYAIDKAYQELNSQFTPDGAQIELSTGYHWVALRNLIHIPLVARAVDRVEELPDDFLMRAEKAFDFTLLMLCPDGSTPRVNDTPNSQNAAAILKVGSELFPERDDYRWAASGRTEGQPPRDVSHGFPFAGYCVMRSSWEADANMLCFDAGPTGIAHIHQDKLNVMLWAYGREILLDTGGGPYESSEWRRYGLDTHSHNTILVDGLPQRRQAFASFEPLEDVTWRSLDDFDFAAGIYDDLYDEGRPTAHHRRILFVKPDIFFIVDTLLPTGDGEHVYQARWHFKEPNVTLSEETGAAVSTDEGLPNLALIPLLQEGVDIECVSAQEEPELMGWWIRKRVDVKAVPAATICHTTKARGTCHLATLLLPLEADTGNPIVEVSQRDEYLTEVRLADRRRIICEFDPHPDGQLKITEVMPGDEVGRSIHSEA